MSVAFKKRIKELKDQGKLTDFEHNQLICLNSIMGSLVGIDDTLEKIKLCLGVISDK